jgi:hypothetical protein
MRGLVYGKIGGGLSLKSRVKSMIAILLAIISGLLALVLGISVGSAFAASDGEPPQVVIATWMRDNHMGWAVARAEDIYFTYINVAEVGGEPEISAQFPTAETDEFSIETVEEVAVQPETAPVQPEPTDSPVPRAHLEPPAALISPVSDPEPGEGQWQPVASKVDKIPAIYVTRVRADDIHTKYYATAMWIDTE